MPQAQGRDTRATRGERPHDLPLFMTTAPHSGGEASRDAAADIRPHAAKLRARVLAFIASCGTAGCTRA